MTALYKDFGDVRSGDFMRWWTEGDRGVQLFAEPPLPKVQIVDLKQPIIAGPNELIVKIPLSLPKRFIKARVAAILGAMHEGRQGVRNFKSSRAKYPLAGRYDVQALERSLSVYDLRLKHPEKPLWEIARIAKAAPLSARQFTVENEADKKVQLANAALRYWKRASRLIEHVGKGRFPDFS